MTQELQCEAAWALTGIASGEEKFVDTLVEHGAIPIFVRLLRTGDPRIAEQSAWAIGNMAGENPESRDLCLAEGVMPALVEAAGRYSTNAVLFCSLAWTVSNLCRGEPKPSLTLVSPAIPVLAQLTRAASYQSFITDACWALFFISDISDEAVGMILATGIASHLVSLLSSSTSFELLLPVVRTVGNILSGNEGQTQRMIDAGAIPALSKILEIEQVMVWREVCWALSNIAAGSSQQVQALFDATPPVFPKIVEILRTSTIDVEVQREALWVVSNGLGICSWESILYLVNTLQVLHLLCGLLSSSDEEVVTGTLQGIHKLLERAADKGQLDRFIAVLEEMGAIDVLENLQLHASFEIYQEALKILETFFSVE